MERIWLGWLLGSVLVIFLFIGCRGNRPPNLGVKEKRLSPCPSSPNCVSSQSGDERHKIDPIRFTSTPAEALDRLKKVIRGMKRGTVIQETPDYLHVEFRTFLGFVDDAEFYVDGSQKVIHLRSASRVGCWDLGVNRRRMESIREEFGRK
jgi:uncharacterized protein (DUF1499 family)